MMPGSETRFGTWVSYSGTDAVILAVVLLAVAGLLALLAARSRAPLEAARPGPAIAALVVVIWLLSIVMFLVCAGAEVEQLTRAYPGDLGSVPVDPISPITDTLVALTFVVVFVIVFYQPRGSLRLAFGSAFIGALAAPMIFELPFDLIVMARTYPPIPPDPTLYRLLFFLPLFLVEVSTFALLLLAPLARVIRSTLVALTAMFVVFAFWAGLFGFAYPAAAGPTAMNVASKILAFAAAITLFLPPGWRLSRESFSARRGAPWVPPTGL